MISNLIVPVPKSTITELKTTLFKNIMTANSISVRSTPAEINNAEICLHTAKALFMALKKMNVLNNYLQIEDDINRIEIKIHEIKRERNKKIRPVWLEVRSDESQID